MDVASDSLTIEITGDEDKIDSMLKLLRGFGVKEIARTGRVAMIRGALPSERHTRYSCTKPSRSPSSTLCALPTS